MAEKSLQVIVRGILTARVGKPRGDHSSRNGKGWRRRGEAERILADPDPAVSLRLAELSPYGLGQSSHRARHRSRLQHRPRRPRLGELLLPPGRVIAPGPVRSPTTEHRALYCHASTARACAVRPERFTVPTWLRFPAENGRRFRP
jgi:hypothetical protein